MPETDIPPNRIKRFFSNPIVGGLGTLIGILLAIYFYLDQKEFRKLTYYVHPLKAAIVKAGQVSQLTALYANKPIKTDITAAQIAIWNQGKLSIKSSNILQPIILFTADKTPILEVSIRKVSREVIKLQLKEDESQNGRISISWQILEQDDGGIIQLIYAGSPDVDIRCSGVIEGQKGIEQIIYKRKIESPDEQYRYSEKTVLQLVLFPVIFFLLWFLVIVVRFLKRRRPLIDSRGWFLLFGVAIMSGLALHSYFSQKIVSPPFGF